MILAWLYSHFWIVVGAGLVGAAAAYLFLQPFGRLVAALIVLAIAGLWISSYGASRYAAGEAAGRAQVQKAWDAEALAQRTAYAEAASRAAEKQEADRKAAEVIENGLREKLAAADADGRTLARRLHDYQARAGRCTVPTATVTPSELAGPGGITGSDGAVERATEDVFAACKRDAERLNGWDQWATGRGL